MQFDLPASFASLVQVFFDLGEFIGFVLSEFEKLFEVLYFVSYLLSGFDDGFQCAQLRGDGLGFFGVVPEAGLHHVFF